MKEFFVKLKCKFIGWDYNLLCECSEASHKTLSRYFDAVVLMMILWAYIGYNMAGRYFELESIVGCLIVAAVFAILVWIIERQIILIVGKNKAVEWIRGGLAICMALVGATVTDQVVFRKDIDAAMNEVIETRTDEQLGFRRKMIDERLSLYRMELDSLEIVSFRLAGDIEKTPMVKTYLRSKVPSGAIDSLGRPIMVDGYTQQSMSNPKIADKERIDERLDVIRNNIISSTNELQTIRDELRKENEDNIGLLTELEITLSKKVIFSGWASCLFYVVFFFVFLSLELLVVTSKAFAKKCDYEVLVEKQQEKRINQICDVMQMESDSTKE